MGTLIPTGQSFDHDLGDREYERFSKIVYETAGIVLSGGKKDLLRARLGKVMRRRGIPSFVEYLKIVEADGTGEEMTVLLDAISTNVTSFWRESDHFDFIRDTVLPETERRNGKKFRVWCAGCSTGEEPYTLSVTIIEKTGGGWDSKILATDLSTRALSVARNGVYPLDRFKDVSRDILSRYFVPETKDEDGRDYFRVSPEVRKMVSFGHLNLLGDYPFKGPFDSIFCRNVMIYFDRKTQETLVNRYHRYLRDGGYLFIGHSESLNGVSHPFKYVRPSVYRKDGGGTG